jgi:hypothetical protein
MIFKWKVRKLHCCGVKSICLLQYISQEDAWSDEEELSVQSHSDRKRISQCDRSLAEYDVNDTSTLITTIASYSSLSSLLFEMNLPRQLFDYTHHESPRTSSIESINCVKMASYTYLN